MKQYGRDWFIETMPEVIELVEAGKIEAEARGVVKGREEGETKGLRQAVLDLIQIRFPTLMILAQKQLATIEDPATIRKLNLDILQASDEVAVHKMLKALTKSRTGRKARTSRSTD